MENINFVNNLNVAETINSKRNSISIRLTKSELNKRIMICSGLRYSLTVLCGDKTAKLPSEQVCKTDLTFALVQYL